MVKRNVGIELLRIVSMFLIVVSHICTQGGVLNAIKPFTINYVIVWTIMCVAYCATNCYALISGYVGVEAQFDYYRIGVLWLRVIVYTVTITFVFGIIKPEKVMMMDWIAAFTPVTSNQYWYFSSYFALFFLIPFLNFILKELSNTQIGILVCSLIVIFSLLPTLRHVDAFATNGGYSTFWLIVLYIIGGYLKRTQLLYRLSKGKWFLVLVGMLLLAIFSKLTLEYFCWKVLGVVAGGGYLLTYTSPVILLEAIAFLGILVQTEIKHKKLVFKVSNLSFSVYIIHQHGLIKAEFIKGKFGWYTELAPMNLILRILGTALVVYIICIAIDYVREKIFTYIKVKRHCHDMFDFIQRRIFIRWKEK